MTTVAILPVKQFAHAKQRLAASLPADVLASRRKTTRRTIATKFVPWQ